PITLDVKGVTLGSALRLMLRELDLKYVIHNEALLITTAQQAATMVEPRVYMVGDLVNQRGPYGLPMRRVVWPLRAIGRGGAGRTGSGF
ncbi:MAG: hypothetical protein ACREJM_08045, partial [Candidatus Saccharimonadales bacterium]